MKKIYFFFLVACFSSASFAQAILIDGNGGYSGNSVVGQSNYHVSESIYTNEEIGPNNYIGAGAAIQQVFFALLQEGINPAISNYRVYMKNIPATTTILATGAYSTAGYTQVYNGVLNATPLGYVLLTLTTPFARTAGSNLEVLIERVDNVLHTGIIFQTANGNDVDAAANSSRRYNGTTLPVSGTTSLTETAFRPTIAFNHTFPIDALLTDIFLTNGISCYTGSQPLSVEILNGGTTPIAPGAASVTVNIFGNIPSTATLTNTNTILPNEFDTINFAGINLDTFPSIALASVTLAGDGTTYNDTIGTFISASAIDTLQLNPGGIVEDFEEQDPTPQDVFPYQKIIAGDDFYWFPQVGPYDLTLTPPLNPATGAQFYIFDSYDALPETITRLHSECIKLPAINAAGGTSTTGALLTFQMSHDSSFPREFSPVPLLDSMYVTVSQDQGVTWTRLAGYQRYDATALIPAWRIESVDLDAYAGQTIQIGFEGVSKFGNVFGLDDIHIDTTFLAPITLLDFTAQRNNTVNNLGWRTSQELNSNKFIIERSTDGGRNFNPIGQVNAAGFSSVERSYHFTDASPIKGINYYRLRIVDLDNSYKFSAVRNVRNLGVSDFSFAPNPVQQKMNINLDAEKAGEGSISITDMSGRQVYNQQVKVIAGNNTIPVETARLSPGSYIIAIQLSDGRIVRKFNKI